MSLSAASSGDFSVLAKAGTLGSVATCALFTPLDVLRHSAQASVLANKAAPSIVETFRAVAQSGYGYGGFWRGMPSALISASLSPFTFLLFYEMQRGNGEVSQSAAIARGVQTLLVQPFEFIRTTRQAQFQVGGGQSAHLTRRVWDIILSEGTGSLWRGLIPTLYRDVGATTIFGACYLRLERALHPEREDEEYAWEAPPPPLAEAIAMTSVSAAVAAAVTHPIDVVRTHMQAQKMVESQKSGYKMVTMPRMKHASRNIYRVAGLSGFTAGLAARVGRATLVGAALGPLFEYGMLISRDALRPKRVVLYIGEDPSATIVHPRAMDAWGGRQIGSGSHLR